MAGCHNTLTFGIFWVMNTEVLFSSKLNAGNFEPRTTLGTFS